MDDLIEFLRARLDERARAAEAATPGPWHVDTGTVYATSYGDQIVDYTESAEHVAANDPTFVLADVDAKRQILDEHPELWRDIGWLEDGDEAYAELPVCERCVPKHSHYRTRAEVPEYPCRTLRLLALPYAGHPDYRAEWRP